MSAAQANEPTLPTQTGHLIAATDSVEAVIRKYKLKLFADSHAFLTKVEDHPIEMKRAE